MCTFTEAYGRMCSDFTPSLVYRLTSAVTAVTIESMGVTPLYLSHVCCYRTSLVWREPTREEGSGLRTKTHLFCAVRLLFEYLLTTTALIITYYQVQTMNNWYDAIALIACQHALVSMGC